MRTEHPRLNISNMSTWNTSERLERSGCSESRPARSHVDVPNGAKHDHFGIKLMAKLQARRVPYVATYVMSTVRCMSERPIRAVYRVNNSREIARDQ